MPIKKKSRAKEYTLFGCAVSSIVTAVIIYAIIAMMLAMMISRGTIGTQYAHYLAVAIAGVSCFAGVLINGRKIREKSIQVALITAGVAVCFLLLLPLTDAEGAKSCVGWHSIMSTVAGCLFALAFTKRIKGRRRRK